MKRLSMMLSALLVIIAGVVGNAVLVLGQCCDDRVPWNSSCRDTEGIGICEDMPIADCPAVPDCDSITRRYYIYEPNHECKEEITMHTLCVVGEERDHCYVVYPCHKAMVGTVDVCVLDGLNGWCDDHWIYVAEMWECEDCEE